MFRCLREGTGQSLGSGWRSAWTRKTCKGNASAHCFAPSNLNHLALRRRPSTLSIPTKTNDRAGEAGSFVGMVDQGARNCGPSDGAASLPLHVFDGFARTPAVHRSLGGNNSRVCFRVQSAESPLMADTKARLVSR